MLKPVLGAAVYFIAMLLIGYYFVRMSLIISLQMAASITVVHILMQLTDRFYKNKKRTNKL